MASINDFARVILWYNRFRNNKKECMDIKEANKIIKDYKKTINKGTEGKTSLRRLSWLPYSKPKIKYAYFYYLENIINKKGYISNKIKDSLITSYSLLNNFVDDSTVDKYVKIYKDWQSKKSNFNKSKKDEKLIKQYLYYTYMLKSSELYDEINEYIEELVKK